MKRSAALGTEHLAFQQIGRVGNGFAFFCFLRYAVKDILYLIEQLMTDNRFMCVLYGE
jgi:hypothetical protein